MLYNRHHQCEQISCAFWIEHAINEQADEGTGKRGKEGKTTNHPFTRMSLD